MAEIITGGKDLITIATSLLAAAFAHDPITAYVLCSFTDSQRITYLPKYYRTLLTAAILSGGEIAAIVGEDAEWKAGGVIMLPGKEVHGLGNMMKAGTARVMWDIGLRGNWRTTFEIVPQINICKSKVLKSSQKYYYIFLIATREDFRGKGLCHKIIRNWQERAADEGFPIWLEAMTPLARNVYLKCGFEEVGEIVVGKGKVDEKGVAMVGGGGMRIYGMIWWPKRETPA
ncbi:hypothetical protein BGZ60DRAFT_410611 [Tricladium varicosporioides]|nr:hypothetical protein BGZ60DRAFT_410611 [Hymenoscyphus varicosporioides]